MSGAMKVHLYQVMGYNNTQPLAQTLEEIRGTRLESRLRLIGKQELRMEKIYAPKMNGNTSDYWLMDFTRLRFDHGPGRASRTTPIAGFDLQDNEGFGEETSALYDVRRGYLLVQYNHFGVRSGLIKEYFSQFAQGVVRVYDIFPKLDESSEQKLAQKQVLKSVTFKVAAASISQRQRSAGVSVDRALELSNHLNGQSIEVTISAGRSMNTMLSRGRVMATVRQIQKLVGVDDDGAPVVSKLEVVGKATADSISEPIDMLTPKLEVTIDGLVLGGRDRRYTFESRARALLRARAGWEDIISS